MEMSRLEALDMFKKWHAERTPIRCQIPLRKLAAAFSAHVYSVSETLLVLTSEDLTTELNVPLTPDLFYGYGEPRNGDPYEATIYDAAVIIFLEPIPPIGLGDLIALSELRDSTHSQV